MSISAYSSSLAIPPYPGSTTRTNDAKPPARDADATPTRQAPNRPDTALPSTGLLNTVV